MKILNTILVFIAEVTESRNGVKWNILGKFGTVVWGDMEQNGVIWNTTLITNLSLEK